MDIVTILLSNAKARSMDEFVHGETLFIFDQLTPDGPTRMIEGPVWVFVDWVLEELAGLEMCRRLRADTRTADAHITIVLEEDDPEDRRRALRAGADDYMVGPLDRTAMLDRVLALQSANNKRRPAKSLDVGKLEIDLAAVKARWDGKPIITQPNEFRLLRYFAENPDQLLSREELIEGLGKQDPPIDYRTVDVWIGRLRRALREAGAGMPLRTVRSRGYVFDTDI